MIALCTSSYALERQERKAFSKKKRQEKIEHRLDKKEASLEKYFEKKRALLQKKYEKRLTRLENRKHKLSQARYERSKNHIEKWYRHEMEQLSYQEKNLNEKMTLRKEKLSP